MAPQTVPDVPVAYTLRAKGRVVVAYYLALKALHGELPDDVIPGDVMDGVDVFSASPDALPFQRRHSREYGEVWGYFFAAQPPGERPPAPGGCWLRHGADKAYSGGDGGEVVAFRRRFAFHVTWRGRDGRVAGAKTQWMMKEYRLNKGAAAFRRVQPDPMPNMDCVVRKVYRKALVPPPRPFRSGDEEGSGYSSVDQPAAEEE